MWFSEYIFCMSFVKFVPRDLFLLKVIMNGLILLIFIFKLFMASINKYILFFNIDLVSCNLYYFISYSTFRSIFSMQDPMLCEQRWLCFLLSSLDDFYLFFLHVSWLNAMAKINFIFLCIALIIHTGKFLFLINRLQNSSTSYFYLEK